MYINVYIYVYIYKCMHIHVYLDIHDMSMFFVEDLFYSFQVRADALLGKVAAARGRSKQELYGFLLSGFRL